MSSLALVAAVLPAVEKKRSFHSHFGPAPAPTPGLADGECACFEGSEGQAQLEGGREGTPPADSTESWGLSGDQNGPRAFWLSLRKLATEVWT